MNKLCGIIICLAFMHFTYCEVDEDMRTVSRWAGMLGEEIWRLGLGLTKAEELKAQYYRMNISVKRKNGLEILDSAVTSVGRMLARKIDAVKCIYYVAKEEASKNEQEDFNLTSYCSNKYSERLIEQDDGNFTHEDNFDDWLEKLPKSTKENREELALYENMTLHEDSHFYNLLVTTAESCVHVPTNIYDLEHDAAEAIAWSEKLDEVFDQNYKSDPSLVWQYFGSSTGVMRLFPGMSWNEKPNADTYDCRVRSWYIEAATCSKDMIILFDVSGSMTGSKNYVARKTLQAILQTLSNNDYVNVFYFKNITGTVVSCFEDLVQATPENLRTLREHLEPKSDGKTLKIPLEGYANLTIAFTKAFGKLKEYREMRNCGHDMNGCNQLIMLITDYVAKNFTDLFLELNREPMEGTNETFIPVRIFTYLVGKEVTNVPETQWISCFNRGYFTHIRGVEEVQQQVLKYINVIARPMILQGSEPPPTWTHAYIDMTRTKDWEPASSDVNTVDSDKLVTSVAIPVFDTTVSSNNSENITANLLGVVGTDVPIDSIAKLTLPHKLGVNGYSFIVSNNGYLLLHPGLVTSINGTMQDNYNSVDFVEVEQIDDGKGSRELGEEITALRNAMVNGERGSKLDYKVLYHYDDMRRIARVSQDYFYSHLTGTPFSIGIALPFGYGNTLVEVGNVAIETDVVKYFNSSFRIHPDWIYCKHHYLENHESDTPEEEIWKFLNQMGTNTWVWKEQYEEENTESQEFLPKGNCGRAKLNTEDYYCNRDLVEGLIFDAKLTDPYYKTWENDKTQWKLAKKYNASVRFISTMNGLTRWQYIFDSERNEIVDKNGRRSKLSSTISFGDIYPRAIEETWYKAAVIQHTISKGSFVLAVPVRSRDDIKNAGNITEDITITASMAIFPRTGREESPASVVGFQFSYDQLRSRFENMTKADSKKHFNGGIVTSCNDPEIKCYLVDSSGYMVSSEIKSDVGGFFGVREPNVLQDMVYRTIFQKLTVYDYQTLCIEKNINVTGSSCRVSNPIYYIRNTATWLVGKILLYMNLWNWNIGVTFGFDYDPEYELQFTSTTAPEQNETLDEDTIIQKEALQPFSCDKEIRLFILNQSRFTRDPTASSEDDVEYKICTPRWWATMVPQTNLLLVVVHNEHKCMPLAEIHTEKMPTIESTREEAPCHKLELGSLHRTRLEGCFTYHPQEKYVMMCGRGYKIGISIAALIFCLFISIRKSIIS